MILKIAMQSFVDTYLRFGDRVWGQLDNSEIPFADGFFQIIITDPYKLIHVGWLDFWFWCKIKLDTFKSAERDRSTQHRKSFHIKIYFIFRNFLFCIVAVVFFAFIWLNLILSGFIRVFFLLICIFFITYTFFHIENHTMITFDALYQCGRVHCAYIYTYKCICIFASFFL